MQITFKVEKNAYFIRKNIIEFKLPDYPFKYTIVYTKYNINAVNILLKRLYFIYCTELKKSFLVNLY